MDSAVTVALVTSGCTLVAAGGAGVTSWRAAGRSKTVERERELERYRHDLQRAAKDADRRADAEAVLDGNRRPLLASAVELRRRLGNIMANGFLSYLDGEGIGPTWRFAARSSASPASSATESHCRGS